MKKTLFILFILFFQGISFAQLSNREQKVLLQDAEFLISLGDHLGACPLLENLYQNDSSNASIAYSLGKCYLEIRDKQDLAHLLLEKASSDGILEANYYLGKAHLLMEDFSNSIQTFEYYLNYATDPKHYEEVLFEIQRAKRAQFQYEHPRSIQIKNLDSNINTAFHEYAPLVTADGTRIYYTSRRPGGFSDQKDPNNHFFEDIYQSSIDHKIWGKSQNLGTRINTESHDAAVGISPNGGKLLLYRTNKNLTGGDLYLSNFKQEWQIPQLLPLTINSPYQEASACLSIDEQTMYFSSNRPGGFGGKDLYKVQKLPNGNWGKAINLGPTINTYGDEDAPFIQVDNQTLFFASTKHQSIGGYDLFKSKKRADGNWQSPESLGYPINTVRDDIFLVVSPNGEKGYYSSQRKGGFGGQDLYEISFQENFNSYSIGTIFLFDTAKEPISAKITLINSTHKKLQGIYKTTFQNGKSILLLHPNTQFQIYIEADGYLIHSEQFITDDSTPFSKKIILNKR